MRPPRASAVTHVITDGCKLPIPIGRSPRPSSRSRGWENAGAIDRRVTMKHEGLRKNVGKRVQLDPPARRMSDSGADLGPMNDDWLIEDVSDDGVSILNLRTRHQTTLGFDHIHHFTSDPTRASGDGIEYGFLTLTIQVFIQGRRLWIRPNSRPGEPRPDPSSHVDHILARRQRAIATMPELADALSAALRRYPLVREFFVLRKDQVLGGSDEPRFWLFKEDLPDLISKLRILQGHGLLLDVTKKTAPIFRITEDLIELLSERKDDAP